MNWNYRVVKHIVEDSKCFQIHEVHYDKENNPEAIAEEGCVPFGDTTEELSRAMIHMMSALTKPVLDATLFSPDPSPSATINATLGMLKKNV